MKTEKYQTFYSWGVPVIQGWYPVAARNFPFKTLVHVRLTRTNFHVGPGPGHLDFEDLGFCDPGDSPKSDHMGWQNKNGQAWTFGPPTHWRYIELLPSP